MSSTFICFLMFTCSLTTGLELSSFHRTKPFPQQHDELSTTESTADPQVSHVVTVTRVQSNRTDVASTREYVLKGLEHKTLRLVLVPNQRLMSPNFVVSVKRSEHENQETLSTFQQDNRHFFYNGHIRKSRASVVAVHLRRHDKMSGLIAYGHQSYLIEPASDERYHLLKPLAAQTWHQNGCPLTISKPSSRKQFIKVDDHDANGSLSERRRRSVTRSIQKFVETTVVVDQSMIDFHGNQTMLYVMSIMNVVHRLFRDQSIGHAIDIVVSQIKIINTKSLMNLTGEANKDLNTFCQWKHQKGNRRNTGEDLSILLTRNDLCVPNEEISCQETWGLAYVGGACRDYNCALVKDRGFLTAYSIAHEIGHSLGMQHDDDANSPCLHPNNQPYIMLSHWKRSRMQIGWSKCSSKALSKFLQTAACLDNNPHDVVALPADFPFNQFNASEQCKFSHGPQSQLCQIKKNICRELWCQSKPNGSCYRTGFPAADGTICGHKKVCWSGQCRKHHKVPAPSDGSWGEWTAYHGCSRTCGRGVAVYQRACNQPKPSFGGHYCIGKRKRYTLCNSQPCPHGSPSFYTQQCSRQNKIPYKNVLYEWLPEKLPEKECQLTCRVKDQTLVAVLKSKVVDGTECKGNGVCINGHCHTVGCDNHIDSIVKLDRCGVCGGNNSKCHTFSTLYKQQHPIGYEKACYFPIGAQQITVMERHPSINFLALKTSSKFIINGQWEIQQPRTIKVAGTFLKYWRQGRLESFTAMGPINEDLFVYVIFQGSNPGVLCEFVMSTAAAPHNTLPTNEKKQNSSGTWTYSPWSSCSQICGSGIKTRIAKCIKNSQIVNSSMCPDQPETKMQCNIEVCPYWKTLTWTECSTSCGKGIQTRQVICQHSSTYNRCPFNTKPITSKLCFRAPCGNWITGSWSECSKQCGTGVTGRKVSCRRGLCDPHTKPMEMNFCNTQPCHRWLIGQWSECSTSCGDGVKRRVIKCVSQQLEHETSSSQCDISKKPSSSHYCHLKPCPHQTVMPTEGSCTDSNYRLCRNVARLSNRSPGICTGEIASICCETCQRAR